MCDEPCPCGELFCINVKFQGVQNCDTKTKVEKRLLLSRSGKLGIKIDDGHDDGYDDMLLEHAQFALCYMFYHAYATPYLTTTRSQWGVSKLRTEAIKQAR